MTCEINMANMGVGFEICNELKSMENLVLSIFVNLMMTWNLVVALHHRYKQRKDRKFIVQIQLRETVHVCREVISDVCMQDGLFHINSI